MVKGTTNSKNVKLAQLSPGLRCSVMNHERPCAVFDLGGKVGAGLAGSANALRAVSPVRVRQAGGTRVSRHGCVTSLGNAIHR